MKYSLLFLLCVLLLFTVGCAETPSEDIVANKNEGILEDKIENSEGQGFVVDIETTQESDTDDTIDEPNLQTTFTNASGTVTFNVSAQISYPDVDSFPVLKAVRYFLTSDDLRQISTALFGDNPVYEYTEELSKSDLEKEILEIRRKIGDRDYLMEYYNGDEETIARVVANYESRLAALEEAYLLAPDVVGNTPSDFSFHEDSYYVPEYSPSLGIEGILSFKAVSEINGVPMFVWAAQRNDNKYQLSNYICYVHNVESSKEGSSDIQPIPVTESQVQEAVALVEKTLSESGLSGWNIHSYEVIDTRISFICTPEYYGISMSPDQNYGSLSNDSSFSPSYPYPILKIIVTNGQITKFDLDGLLEVSEILNENVALLPYSEIMDKIFEQLKLTWTETKVRDWVFNEPSIKPISASIDITRMELTLVRTAVSDAPDSYYIMPAWMVYGNPILTEYEFDGNIAFTNTNRPESETPLLVINAIDGSVIDMSQGY